MFKHALNEFPLHLQKKLREDSDLFTHFKGCTCHHTHCSNITTLASHIPYNALLEEEE